MALERFTLHSLRQGPKVLDKLQFSMRKKKCLITFRFNLELILGAVRYEKRYEWGKI